MSFRFNSSIAEESAPGARGATVPTGRIPEETESETGCAASLPGEVFVFASSVGLFSFLAPHEDPITAVKRIATTTPPTPLIRDTAPSPFLLIFPENLNLFTVTIKELPHQCRIRPQQQF